MAEQTTELCPKCNYGYLYVSDKTQTLWCNQDNCDYSEYFGENYN